ncbi:MAG TPA: type II toxin-antitoxin system YafQ family toxin [Terracidiphilus sp.]|nr:type II toxin-antitoxin system YafQ family toxin [Terracidiphilus sp.]
MPRRFLAPAKQDQPRRLGDILLGDDPAPAHYRDHPLKGNYVGRRDAHIEPDWVLIYAVTDEILHLERTGAHVDIFEN